MLIVYTQTKNEAISFFTKYFPYLWVNITRNLIHKIRTDICTLQKYIHLISKRKNIISDYHFQTQLLSRPKKKYRIKYKYKIIVFGNTINYVFSKKPSDLA